MWMASIRLVSVTFLSENQLSSHARQLGSSNLLNPRANRSKEKKAVVIGRSNIVGKPVAQLLLQENATVTIAHSRTRDLEKVASEADILVVAIGIAKFIKKRSSQSRCDRDRRRNGPR